MAGSVAALQLDAARAALLRVDETTDDTMASVTVTLARHGEQRIGSAEGSPEAALRPSLVAAATLRAVAEDSHRFTVEAAAIERVGDHRVALVVVQEEGRDRPLTGSALVDVDNHQLGFARATLNAVNRRLQVGR